MLTTSPKLHSLATYSTPEMTPLKEPETTAAKDFHGTTVAPAATPTTPISLLMAAIVPATCMPWPLPSSYPASLQR
jgi:hypothetical protein